MSGSHVAKRKKGAHNVPKTASTAPKRDKKSPKGGKVLRISAIAAGVLAALLMGLAAFTFLYQGIFPRVTVGSIPVGGMDREQAAAAISRQSGALYETARISVAIDQENYEIPVVDVLENIDEEQSAGNAYAIGRTGNPVSRMLQVAGALLGQGDAELAVNINEAELAQAMDGIVAQALTEPVEPTWEISADKMIIHAGKPGVHFDAAAVQAALEDKLRLLDFAPYVVEIELLAAPEIDIDKIAAQAIGEAVNATVDKTDGKTIIPEKYGVQFDIEEARKIIGDGSAPSYTLPVQVTPAKVTAADLKEKLFRDTLARTSTELNEGNVPRTNNVRLAAKAINGTILNPGDEFSYNTVVGERTSARGYQPAGAYSGGKVVEEFGGGVCQPSSTLYMAVLRADLEVVERHNHSFTVSYTPLGEDATVDYGTLDFRFKNNTDYPVKILAEQTDGLMIMTIIGTKVSDKSVEIRTEVLATYSPETIRKQDSSLAPGQTRVETTASTGYSTRTYKQVTENGKTTEVLANESHYSKRDKVVLVGPEPAAAPDPEEPAQPEERENTQDPETGGET